jgi:phage tail-like protein
MAEFIVNAQRLDPYKNFKFIILWDGHAVAACSKVSGLKRTTEVVNHREGSDPSIQRKSAGRTQFEPITIERGVTNDPDFDAWAYKVLAVGSNPGAEVSLKDFRKDIVIQLLNEAGQVAIAYKIYRAWPSEYQIVGELDANANAVAIQTLKLECEGWERDSDTPEPQEPSFQLP